MPEHAFALILALRGTSCRTGPTPWPGNGSVPGKFCFFNHPIHDLAATSLGIIGEGVLGQRVANSPMPSA